MEPIDTLQQAIELVRSGDKASASRLLAKYVTQVPNEDIAWMWLAASLDQPDQQLYCLKKAQSINPSNPGTIQELNSYLGLAAPAAEEEYPINLPPPPPPAPEPEPEQEPEPELVQPEAARVVEPPAAPAVLQAPAPAPAQKPASSGMTGIQIVILVVLIIAILLVAAVLGYIVFGGSTESLPPFLRSLLGAAFLFQ